MKGRRRSSFISLMTLLMGAFGTISANTIRRNLVSIAFPTVVAYMIYKDYSRTQKFKANKLQNSSKTQ
ncbi:hypothetical protein EB796_016960 [Bugula neritina]|uniref:Uncharacterized protein n=1 Tax=Bugula neritina TaxID=10212 RepID=A0A7J7JGI6_BUGNE|nr:hypothetical protein EB796_016960 [Bugula neritina]